MKHGLVTALNVLCQKLILVSCLGESLCFHIMFSRWNSVIQQVIHSGVENGHLIFAVQPVERSPVPSKQVMHYHNERSGPLGLLW